MSNLSNLIDGNTQNNLAEVEEEKEIVLMTSGTKPKKDQIAPEPDFITSKNKTPKKKPLASTTGSVAFHQYQEKTPETKKTSDVLILGNSHGE